MLTVDPLLHPAEQPNPWALCFNSIGDLYIMLANGTLAMWSSGSGSVAAVSSLSSLMPDTNFQLTTTSCSVSTNDRFAYITTLSNINTVWQVDVWNGQVSVLGSPAGVWLCERHCSRCSCCRLLPAGPADG